MTGNRGSSRTTYAMYLLKDKAGYAAVLYAQGGKRLRRPAPAGAARCLGLIQCDTEKDAVLAAGEIHAFQDALDDEATAEGFLVNPGAHLAPDPGLLSWV